MDDFNFDGKIDIVWGVGYIFLGDDGFYIYIVEDKFM